MGQSQTGIVAVPSAADTWTRIVLDTVPADVARLSKVKFAVVPDNGTAAISVRDAPVFRIFGSGLAEQSPHEYLGMFAGVAVVTDGTMGQENLITEYDVDIPVNVAGTLDVQVNTLDEAITAGTVLYELTFDKTAATAVNQMSTYIDAAQTTTADAYASVGTITIPVSKEGKDPTKIKKLAIGLAPDSGTSAISLRGALRIRLTGAGIAEGGLHEFIGPTHVISQVTAGANTVTRGTYIQDVDIPINAGGQIVVEQRLEVETPTAGTVAVGLLFA